MREPMMTKKQLANAKKEYLKKVCTIEDAYYNGNNENLLAVTIESEGFRYKGILEIVKDKAQRKAVKEFREAFGHFWGIDPKEVTIP